jgi:hypothetical protein
MSVNCCLLRLDPRYYHSTLGTIILGELAEFLPYRSQRISVPYGYDYQQEWIEKAMADTTPLWSKSSFGPSVKEAFLSDARSRKGLTSFAELAQCQRTIPKLTRTAGHRCLTVFCPIYIP